MLIAYICNLSHALKVLLVPPNGRVADLHNPPGNMEYKPPGPPGISGEEMISSCLPRD